MINPTKRKKILLLILLFSLGAIWSCVKEKNPRNYPDRPDDLSIDNGKQIPHYQNYRKEIIDNNKEDITIKDMENISEEGNYHKNSEKHNIIRKNGAPRDDNQGSTPPDSKAQYSSNEDYFEKAKALQKEFPNLFVMEGNNTKKGIAITFDDGPDPKTTPEILDILKEYNVAATFFVVGKNAKEHPQVLKRILDEGHQVAAHSWSHKRPTELANHEFLQDIDTTSKILGTYGEEYSPKFYRPPYGLLKPHQIELMGSRGYLTISWSIDSLDWYTSDEDKIYKKVIDSIHPGAIILMHSAGGKDRRIGTVKALPKILENLLDQGYKPVTVKKLLSHD